MNASIIEDKPIIYIKTLGGFSLRVGDKEITDNSNQSKKPWCLLEYLVVFQKKSISPGELINIVWADDPGVNPGGALKTLMFRSRRLREFLPRSCWSSREVPIAGRRTIHPSWTLTSLSPSVPGS